MPPEAALTSIPPAQKLQRSPAEVSGDKETHCSRWPRTRRQVVEAVLRDVPRDMKHIFHVKRLHLNHVASGVRVEGGARLDCANPRRRCSGCRRLRPASATESVKLKSEASQKSEGEGGGEDGAEEGGERDDGGRGVDVGLTIVARRISHQTGNATTSSTRSA